MRWLILLGLLVALLGCGQQPDIIIISDLGANSFQYSFTNSDLNNNILTVNTGLDSNAVEVHVFNNNHYGVIPSYITLTSGNIITIDFTGLTPITGTWNLVVLKRSNGSYEKSFTNSDLSGGILSLTHGLDSTDLGIQVFDDSNNLISPDNITIIDLNQVNIDMSSFTVSGKWGAVVLSVLSSSDFAETFNNSDLDGNVLIVTHNLGTRNIGAYAFNNSGQTFFPAYVQAVSDTRVNVDLTGLVPVSGTWYIDVFSTGSDS